MLEERGALMVSPGEAVYEGMIIGENAKPEDLSKFKGQAQGPALGVSD